MEEHGKPQIKIAENGPYLVSGSVPLNELIMVTRGHQRSYEPGCTFPSKERYALCRCGQSRNAPFCDGSHVASGFEGKETASRAPYDARVQVFEGPTLDLYDDNRCGFARFCHGSHSEAWTLTENSQDPAYREEAIRSSTGCPTGRLVHHDKMDGYAEIEPELLPAVSILQDPEKDASSMIFVQGGIELVSTDGTAYETRNRYALCRCGCSSNKPFCDASHIPAGYDDGLDGR